MGDRPIEKVVLATRKTVESVPALIKALEVTKESSAVVEQAVSEETSASEGLRAMCETIFTQAESTCIRASLNVKVQLRAKHPRAHSPGINMMMMLMSFL